MKKEIIMPDGDKVPMSKEDLRWFLRGWWYVFPLLLLDIYLGLRVMFDW